MQGSGWDALISARLPIPAAASATCQICDQDDYRCLATAAQAGSAHTLPVPAGSHCVPVLEMWAALQPRGRARALLFHPPSYVAEIRMPATGVEGSRHRGWEQPGAGIDLQVGAGGAPKPQVWCENGDLLSPSACHPGGLLSPSPAVLLPPGVQHF